MDKEANELKAGELEVRIQEIVNRINNDSSVKPEELERIKKLIKKNVPFFMRSAFSAFILRELYSSTRCEKKERKERDAKKEEKVLPEGARTLYLNVGKMKHLYAKNLSQLLQTELGIDRSDIYSLRIHEKYSFITMSEENCNRAIETLNGKEINGRVCQINYSNR